MKNNGNKCLPNEFGNDLKTQYNTNFGLFNLSRLNEEAIHDAITRFNKSCPYCENDLYKGNIRRKIEIDHFFPISRGGQDFPWNILPCCKECNMQKRNKMPYEFLTPEKYRICFEYLGTVKERITSLHEDKLLQSELASILLSKYATKSITKDKLIFELLNIYNLIPQYSISNRVDFPKSNLQMIREFIDIVKYEKEKFIFKYKDDGEFLFWLSEAIRIYIKRVPKARNRIDILTIKRTFKTENSFILNDGLVVKFNGKSTRFLLLSYEKMNDEWKQIYDEILK